MRKTVILLAAALTLIGSNSSAKELECSAVQGAGKVAIGAALGSVAAVTVTWGAAIVTAPFTAGSSFGAAFYGTPAAAAWGAKGGAILGGYSEASDCLLKPFDEKSRR